MIDFSMLLLTYGAWFVDVAGHDANLALARLRREGGREVITTHSSKGSREEALTQTEAQMWTHSQPYYATITYVP